MEIRKGSIADFEGLDWSWRDLEETRERYKRLIEKGDQEFWVVGEGDELIGEIHIFWVSDDHELADGRGRAYLSTFRVHPDYQGRGIGKQLFERAVERVREKGFREATIGGYVDEVKTQELYRRWGFITPVKKSIDRSSGVEREFIVFLKDLSLEKAK